MKGTPLPITVRASITVGVVKGSCAAPVSAVRKPSIECPSASTVRQPNAFHRSAKFD